MIVFMVPSLPHWALDIFATGKRVNYGGEYPCKFLWKLLMETPANFYFYATEKAIKLAEKHNNKD